MEQNHEKPPSTSRLRSTIQNFNKNRDIIIDEYGTQGSDSKKNILAVIGLVNLLFSFLDQTGLDVEALKESVKERLPFLQTLFESQSPTFQEFINRHWYDAVEVEGTCRYELSFKDNDGNELTRISFDDTICLVKECSLAIFHLLKEHWKSCHEPSTCHMCIDRDLITKTILNGSLVEFEKEKVSKNSNVESYDSKSDKDNNIDKDEEFDTTTRLPVTFDENNSYFNGIQDCVNTATSGKEFNKTLQCQCTANKESHTSINVKNATGPCTGITIENVGNNDCTDNGMTGADPAGNVLQTKGISGGINTNRSISPHNLDTYGNVSDFEANSYSSQDDDTEFKSGSTEDNTDSNSGSSGEDNAEFKSDSSWITFDDNEPEALRCDSESTSSFPEEIEYDEFCQKIMAKYSALQTYMNEKKLKKPKGEKTQCLIYREQDGTIKHKFFLNKAQALNWSYENKKTMEQYLPVILTTNRYNSLQSRKKKIGKAVVGTELSPNVKAFLRIPYGTSESNSMDFFIDTGADGGSVGYDCKALQGFIFSMEEIENEGKPVIFGQISIQERDFEEIQSFDIDRDPNWNALGLEQIKHFHSMYHYIEKDMTVLLQPDAVLIKDSGAYTEIVIHIENVQVPPRQPGELSHPESESTKDNLPTGATCNPSCLEVSDDVSSGQTGVADANYLGATSNPSSSENGASLLPNERVSSEIGADTYSVVTSADNTFNVEANSRSSPSAAGLTLSEITESLLNATMIPDCS